MASTVLNVTQERIRFGGTAKMVLIGLMVLGAICLGLSGIESIGGEFHDGRFWTNYLHNTIFFTGVAFMMLFFLAAMYLAYSGWHVVFKRVLEAYSLFLPIGLLLMIPIIAGVWLHWHHIYHWAAPGITETDKIIAGKSGFLNPTFFTVFSLVVMAFFAFYAFKIRGISVKEDEEGTKEYSFYRKLKVNSGIFLPIAGFTSAGIIWLWVMSIDPHWYSTLYAWYATASWLVAAIAMIILTIIFLKFSGYFSFVSDEHLHDLGKYLFGFSVFWTYLWFSQYMLIWYSNVGEETIYFQQRQEQYPVLFWANLAINFILPFFVLMRNSTKRRFGTLGFVAAMLVFGHWLDYYQMIKPGAHLAYHEHALHSDHHGDDHHDAEGAHSSVGHGGADHHGNDNQDHGDEHHGGEHHSDGHHGDPDDTTLSTESETASPSDGVGGMMYPGDTDETASAAVGDRNYGRGDNIYADTVKEHHEPPAYAAGWNIPGLLELGTFAGFLAGFIFVGLLGLDRAGLYPVNDPYLAESTHHHV